MRKSSDGLVFCVETNIKKEIPETQQKNSFISYIDELAKRLTPANEYERLDKSTTAELLKLYGDLVFQNDSIVINLGLHWNNQSLQSLDNKITKIETILTSRLKCKYHQIAHDNPWKLFDSICEVCNCLPNYHNLKTNTNIGEKFKFLLFFILMKSGDKKSSEYINNTLESAYFWQELMEPPTVIELIKHLTRVNRLEI